MFQGSPLGARVYVYKEVWYMAKVGPGRTDLPNIWSDDVEYACDIQRYSTMQ